jgi:hypothetical protein
MLETVKKLFESLKGIKDAAQEIGRNFLDSLKGMKDTAQEIAPGLKNFGPEVTAELSRLGTQGAMELASALFNGDGFVPYGPGQYTPTADHEPGQGQQHEHEHELTIER